MRKMNKKKMLTVMALTVAALLAVVFAVPKILNLQAGKIMEEALGGTRATLYGDVPQEKRMLVGFGDRIEHEISYGTKEGDTSVQDYLDAGCDPNYCLSLAEESWQYSNPLMLFNTYSMYHTYNVEHPTYPDIDVFNKLVKAGADIHKYPYVWAAVFCHSNRTIDSLKSFVGDGQTEAKLEFQINGFISDSNRVLKLFLDTGADVNRKGSPVPFDYEKSKKMTEEEVQRHFNSPEATTPLYEAIKKGMLWESQVDLLLEYGAALDESCMEAARLSGDDAMIEKVENLLKAASI